MLRISCAILCALTAVVPLVAQTDPGPVVGRPDAGRPLPGLTPSENAAFQEGMKRFREVDSVAGTQPGAPGKGLGPRFNGNSCAQCHAQPSVGGSSSSLNAPQVPQANPQVALATTHGASNRVPSFIQPGGPIRVVRFVNASDGTPDGGVHALYTITGRADARGCNIPQPDFEEAVRLKNAIFRIPTPVYGAGLMEAIPDAAILTNKAANAQQKTAMGIAGHENRNGNDGTITRFGWKAQNKSLEIFSGEAYNVEMGVTNEVFPTERDETRGCVLNATPEDHADYTAASFTTGMSDVSGFSAFMRFLDQPAPAQNGAPPGRGPQIFNQVGCALCHTPSLNTGLNSSAALSQKNVRIFSDLLVHHMGSDLADGISQGLARGDEFRTSPLWGLAQRVFFMHDGRASDLVQSIQQHSGPGSESNRSVDAFNGLSAQDKQDLLNFLRTL